MPKVAIDEPITVAGKANPDGATVLPLKDFWREKKRRNRAPKTREELESALAVHDRFMAISTEIRERAGLPPLVERDQVKRWRADLAAKPQAKAKKPRKVATGARIELTPAQRVDAQFTSSGSAIARGSSFVYGRAGFQ
jgi:hypothetical protein